MDAGIDLARLSRSSIVELEALYAKPAELALPQGSFRGTHLAWLDTPESRSRLWRPLLRFGFVTCPFGIDFDERLWFFIDQRLALGRFEMQPGRSRWREVDTVQLHYQVSLLPRPVRSILYDEVKPLTTDLCLGMGGFNAPNGRGACFLFALERIST